MEAKKTKKKTSGKIAAAVLVIAAAVLLFGGHSGLFNKGGGEHIGIATKAAVDSITVKWKKQDDVDYYEIYRADITERRDNGEDVDEILKFKDYENITYVAGSKRAYVDTDVQTGRTYAYVVSGFRKSFGHMKQVCTSYIEDSATYETAGPAKPGLLNNGEGENHENSKNKIYLYCEVYEGVEPSGVELYRKSSADPDYKQIDFKSPDGANEKELLDDTVTPGETYTYKARTFAEENGQKYYSPYSDEVTIPAVNLIALYDVTVIDSGGAGGAENSDDTFVIRITSGADNGVTSFDSGMPARYTVQKDKRSRQNVFAATLIGWSKSSSAGNDQAGNEQWQDVPKKGVDLKAGESIDLKYKLSAWEGYVDDAAEADSDVFFGGSEAFESTLFMDETDSGGARYHGSGSGSTIMTLDLVSGKGKAYCDWDY